MKLSELFNKQYWQNNLWFGENSREQNKVTHKGDLLAKATYDERAAFFSAFAKPGQTYVLGMDDSHWGGELDFSHTYANGMRFAFFKVMDGTIATKYWDINRPKAIQAGLIVGEYAWLYPNGKVSCKAQAQAVWDRIKDQPKQLPLTIDFEWTNWNGSPAYPNYNDLDIWVTEFTRLSGYKPMLYSAAGYMNQFGVMPNALRNKFSRFWFANYGVSSPLLPTGFTTWDFWQFAATLEQDFYAPSSTNKKELDGNYWYARLEDLQQLANTNGGTTPTDPPTGGTMNYVKVTASAGLNMRKGAGTSYAKVGALQFDTEVEYDVRQAGWLHIIRARTGGSPSLLANGQPVDGSDSWVSDSYVADISQPSWATTTTPPDPDPEPPPPAGTTIINLEYHIENNELMKIVKDGVTIWSKP